MREITPRFKKLLAARGIVLIHKEGDLYVGLRAGALVKLTYDDVIRAVA